MVDGGEHMTDLAFLALAQDDLEPDAPHGPLGEVHFLGQAFDDAHARRSRAPAFDLDAHAQLVQRIGRGLRRDEHIVCLGVLEGRMREPVRQLAIVGEEDQALAVEVQPPDRKDTAHVVGQQVGHALVRAGVAADVADDAARLVELEIEMLGRLRQRLAVDDDLGNGRVYLDANLGDHPAIHLDQAFDDHLFAGAPAANPGRGHHLVQAFFRHMLLHCRVGNNPARAGALPRAHSIVLCARGGVKGSTPDGRRKQGAR